MSDKVNLDEIVGSIDTSQEVTGWVIITMSEEETEEAQNVWQECTAGRETPEKGCGIEEVEKETV